MVIGSFKSMIEEERELRIRFNVSMPTLYDLAYFSTDLLHMMILCNIIEENRLSVINKIYQQPREGNYIFPNRYLLATEYAQYSHNIRVTSVKIGSWDMVIGAAGVVASVVVPTLLYYINKLDALKDAEVFFNVDSNDPEILRFIEELKGEYIFRNFNECYEFVRNRLERMGYSFEMVDKDVYLILQASTKRTTDIVMTVHRIKKHR